MLYFSGQFILHKLVNEQFLFAAKFSYSIFNKTTDFVNEKGVKMSSKQRQCRNHPNVFCYICGESVLEKYHFNARDFTKKAYKAYFGIKLGDQEKSWTPHKVSKTSASNAQKHCAFGPKVKFVPCGSGFLWYGGNPKVTMTTAAFAWWI